MLANVILVKFSDVVNIRVKEYDIKNSECEIKFDS